MIYLKSAVIGMAGALAATVIWVVARFALPLAVPLLFSRVSGTGSGGVGAVFINTGEILIVALIGFVVGFYWGVRRFRLLH